VIPDCHHQWLPGFECDFQAIAPSNHLPIHTTKPLYNLVGGSGMKSIVIYDSQYGNTEKIAQSVQDVLAEQGEVTLVRVAEYKPDLLTGVDIMIVGSPTQGFRPTQATRDFLKGIPAGKLKGLRVAAFDTRFTQANIQKNAILANMVKLFGYAAEPIAKALQKSGGELVVPPQGFYVDKTEGPLLVGELERSADWTRKLFA
jgi:flavodoxin